MRKLPAWYRLACFLAAFDFVAAQGPSPSLCPNWSGSGGNTNVEISFSAANRKCYYLSWGTSGFSGAVSYCSNAGGGGTPAGISTEGDFTAVVTKRCGLGDWNTGNSRGGEIWLSADPAIDCYASATVANDMTLLTSWRSPAGSTTNPNALPWGTGYPRTAAVNPGANNRCSNPCLAAYVNSGNVYVLNDACNTARYICCEAFALLPTPTVTPSSSMPPTHSQTGSKSATKTRTGTSTMTVTRSPSITSSATRTRTVSPSGTPSASCSASRTSSRSPTSSSSRTPSSSTTASNSMTKTASASRSRTPSGSPSGSAPATRSQTASASVSPSGSSSRTRTPSESPSRTPSRSATASITPSPSMTSSGSPSKSSSRSITGTPSKTPSSTISASISLSSTRTPTQSPSASPSRSPSSSRSTSATTTASITPSRTSTPSNSGSSTSSRSSSTSRTPTATKSASMTTSASSSASRSGTPTKTGSGSPSPSSSPSRSPSRTVTPSLTPSPSETKSRSGSALPTPSISPSALGTPAETPSKTTSPSWTSSWTSTASTSTTPSSSSSVTTSETASITISSTASASSTQTASITATRTSTSSASPKPFSVISVHQSLDNSLLPPAGKIILVTLGFSYDGSLSPFYVELQAVGSPCSGAIYLNSTAVEAQCVPEFIMWGTSTMQLAVRWEAGQLTTSFRKPALASLIPELLPQLPSPCLSYGRMVTITAPYVGRLAVSVAYARRTPAQDGSITEVGCSHITATADSVSCLPLNIPQILFQQPLTLLVQYAVNDVALELGHFCVDTPRLTLLTKWQHATLGIKYQAQLGEMPLGFKTNLATLLTHAYVGRWAAMSNRGSATVLGVSSPGEYPRQPWLRTYGLLIGGPEMLPLCPTIRKTSPNRIQVLASCIGFCEYTIEVTGTDFTAENNTVQMGFGSQACSYVEVVNSTYVRCAGWIALPDIAWENHKAILPGWIMQGSVVCPQNAKLTLYRGSFVQHASPFVVTPGSVLFIVGQNFLRGGAQAAGGTSDAYIGQSRCAHTSILSDTLTSCTVPENVPAEGEVSVVDPAGGQSTGRVSVSSQARLAVWWDEEVGSVFVQLSSGSGFDELLPLSPAPKLALQGVGSASCWVEGFFSSGSPAVLVGKLTGFTYLQNAEEVETVTFQTVGVRAPPGSVIHLVGYCASGAGFTTTSGISSVAYATPIWMAEWRDPFTTEPFAPTTIPALAINVSVHPPPSSTAALSDTDFLSCRLDIAKANDKKPLKAVAGALISTMDETTDPTAVTLIVTFKDVSIENAIFGEVYDVTASCVWTPTGELFSTSPHSIKILQPYLTWQLENVRRETSGEYTVISGATVTTLVRLDLPAGFDDERATCFVDEKMNQGGTLRYPVQRNFDITVNRYYAEDLQIAGPDNANLTIAIQCQLWGQISTSAPSTFRITNAVLFSDDLPAFAILSGSVVPFSFPSFNIYLGSPATLWTTAEATCNAVTGVSFLKIQFGDTGGSTFSLSGGTKEISLMDVYVQGVHDGTESVVFTIQCSVSEADSMIPPLTWSVRLLRLQARAVESGPTSVDEVGKLSATVLRIVVIGDDTATVVFDDAVQRLADTLAIACQYQLQGSNDIGYLRQSSRYMNASAIVNLDGTTLAGKRGEPYQIGVSCSVGGLPLDVNIPATIVSVPPCPVGKYATGFSCDICPAGTFATANRSSPCTKCPPYGVLCVNGVMTLMPNYFRPNNENGKPIGPDSEFHPCYNPKACTYNGTSFVYSCTAGYSGPLCGVCDTVGGYALFGRDCMKCWPGWANYLVLAVAVCAILLATIYVIYRSSTSSRSHLSIIFKITITYIQGLHALQVMNAAGSPTFRFVMQWTEAVSASPFSTGPFRCLWSFSYFTQYVGLLLSPMVVCILLVFIMVVSVLFRAVHCRRGVACSAQQYRHHCNLWVQQRRHIVVMVLFAVLAYMPITGASLKAVRCYDRPIGGQALMKADLTVPCGGREHTILRALAGATLIIYGLGFPLWLLFKIARTNRAMLQQEKFRRAFYFLVDGYKGGMEAPAAGRPVRWRDRASLLWWESAIMLRKAAMVCFSVVVTNSFYQVVGFMLLSASFLALQQTMQPYTSKLLNALESLTLGSLFLTVAISGLLLPFVDGQGKISESLDSSKTVPLVTTTLLIVNFATLLILFVFFIRVAAQRRAVLKSISQRALSKSPRSSDVVSNITTINPMAAAKTLAGRTRPASRVKSLVRPSMVPMQHYNYTFVVNPIGAAAPASEKRAAYPVIPLKPTGRAPFAPNVEAHSRAK